VLAARSHGENPPDWLPNRISPSATETEAFADMRSEESYTVVAKTRVSPSSIIVADRS